MCYSLELVELLKNIYIPVISNDFLVKTNN